MAYGWFEREVSQFPGTFPEVQGGTQSWQPSAALTRLETWPPLPLTPWFQLLMNTGSGATKPANLPDL